MAQPCCSPLPRAARQLSNGRVHRRCEPISVAAPCVKPCRKLPVLQPMGAQAMAHLQAALVVVPEQTVLPCQNRQRFRATIDDSAPGGRTGSRARIDSGAVPKQATVSCHNRRWCTCRPRWWSCPNRTCSGPAQTAAQAGSPRVPPSPILASSATHPALVLRTSRIRYRSARRWRSRGTCARSGALLGAGPPGTATSGVAPRSTRRCRSRGTCSLCAPDQASGRHCRRAHALGWATLHTRKAVVTW